MAIAIPDFAKRIGPLNDVHEEAFTKSGKRTKRSIQKIALSTLSWGPVHENTFLKLQDSLRTAVKLTYPDPQKATCIFTDASDKYWSGIVTQCDEEPLKLPIGEQKHQPLAFLGSAFKSASTNWSTFEKEAYAIFQTFQKLE